MKNFYVYYINKGKTVHSCFEDAFNVAMRDLNAIQIVKEILNKENEIIESREMWNYLGYSQARKDGSYEIFNYSNREFRDNI